MNDTELLKKLKEAEVMRIEAQDAALAEYLSGKDEETQAEVGRVRKMWADYCVDIKAEINQA